MSTWCQMDKADISVSTNQSNSELETAETQPQKRKAGRPKGSTKTKSTEQTWVDKVIQLYEEGSWDQEVCAALKITYSQFEQRYAQDDLFANLIDYGRLSAKAWWLRLGREGAVGKARINYNVWYAVMKNRFGWSDKNDLVIEGAKPINQLSQDEAMAEIISRKEILAKLLMTANVKLKDAAVG